MSEEESSEYQNWLNSSKELEVEDSFGSFLEFGTGGLRGVMGPGTNRMNRFTVGAATQGLSNYLLKSFSDQDISVAIAHDSRNNSKEFARLTAEVFSANGIKAYLFEDLRPTPELSFAIRHLGCKSGVVVTASHNPPEYNGYKVYWEDGSQIIHPQDKEIVEEVKNLGLSEVNFDCRTELLSHVGKEVDQAYLKYLSEAIPKRINDGSRSKVRLVYSSLHGTGITLLPEAFEQNGFTNVEYVKEQSEPNGNFPTVQSPNPEEKDALALGIELSKKVNADVLMATDPDSDRVGIAVQNTHGEFILLNGNQTGALLLDFLARMRNSDQGISKNDYMVKTIVTSDLMFRIAESWNIDYVETLTGFKYIAEIIRKEEGKKSFLMGAEESYGYLFGEQVRDKDAIISCLMIAAMAEESKQRGSSLYLDLGEIYRKHGLFTEVLISKTLKGIEGKKAIASMMDGFRKDGLKDLLGETVVRTRDYFEGVIKDINGHPEGSIQLPSSNVLQFEGKEGSKLSMRPSGTEPKIKFYFSRRTQTVNSDWEKEFDGAKKEMELFIRSLS